MIIRSQDKKSIINFDRVDTVRLSRCVERGVIKEHYQTDIFYDTEDTFGVLGTYSTEEKAIKVLDMIAESYGRMKSCDCYMSGIADEVGRFPQNVIDEFADVSRKLYVFQMPQDSEVTI